MKGFFDSIENDFVGIKFNSHSITIERHAL